MTAEWSFNQESQDASRIHREYVELYERASEATREAQRQGDAQLKAAIAAATAASNDALRICSLSSTLNSTVLERTSWQKSSSSTNKKVGVFQFLLCIALVFVLFQTRISEVSMPNVLIWPVSHIWIAAICATMLIVWFWCSCRCQGSGDIILSVATSLLWFGEAVTGLASCAGSTLDLTLAGSQCAFMCVLHQVPNCWHFKIRLFGFGLLVIETLAMRAGAQEAVLAILYLSISQCFGVALAYISKQQCDVGLFKSFPDIALNKMAADSPIQQIPKRALGGFAGGFAGVSSLKCTYPPALWTVSSSSNARSIREDYEVSCGSSSTVENSIDNSSARHQHLSCWSCSNPDTVQLSDVCSSGTGMECNVYWKFKAASKGDVNG